MFVQTSIENTTTIDRVELFVEKLQIINTHPDSTI